MSCGEVQAIILLQLWHEAIYILIIETPFLSENS